MTRVVHVTSAHRPEDIRIHWRECAALADAGYEVFLVAQEPAPPVSAPGVTVVTVPAAGGGRVSRSTSGVASVIGAALSLDPAVVHLHDPELIASIPYLKARSSAKIVVDLHEDLALQIQHKPWIPKPLRAVLAPSIRASIRASRTMVDLYVVAWPHPVVTTPLDRTIEVHNYPSHTEFQGIANLDDYEDRPPNVLSVGTITEQRAFVEILEAAASLGDQATFTLAGPIMPPELAQTHASLVDRSNAVLPGRLDRTDVSKLLSEARIGLCLLHPTPQYRVAEPTKLYEYLLAGLPIVGCDFGPTKEVIDAHGCGITVDPTQPESIAEAVGYLLANPAEASEMASRSLAISPNFVWERQAERLVMAYERLAPLS